MKILSIQYNLNILFDLYNSYNYTNNIIINTMINYKYIVIIIIKYHWSMA